jgi:hypothetical protein
MMMSLLVISMSTLLVSSLSGTLAFSFTTSITSQHTGRRISPLVYSSSSSKGSTTQLFGLTDRVATKADYGSFTTEDEVRGLFKVCFFHLCTFGWLVGWLVGWYSWKGRTISVECRDCCVSSNRFFGQKFLTCNLLSLVLFDWMDVNV